MPAHMARRAQELAAQREEYAAATVVRAQSPTSVKAGDVALVLGDGTIEGFVGGACAEHSVRAYALRAIQSGEAVLLRILPFGDESIGPEGREVDSEDGAVTVENPCLSRGAIEIFLEPVLPDPRVLVVGETPVAAALRHLGSELGLDAVPVDGDALDPRPGDLALVVAAHGRDELGALRRGLEADLPYVGLVASRKRGDGVLGELRGDGVPDDLLARVDVPAGLELGARTPAEIALSILAKVVAVRRAEPKAHATTAVDPICGMTVAAVESTLSVEHDGETVFFCSEGCKGEFRRRHQHVPAD
ncbi:MAG TPA: XdhC family protein [Thermoleophilaceae bacterium]|nr:XdhC family protein [Thermoleophilaceae bacterium]